MVNLTTSIAQFFYINKNLGLFFCNYHNIRCLFINITKYAVSFKKILLIKYHFINLTNKDLKAFFKLINF